MKKVKSFVRQFEAFVKGDDARAKAEKVYRQVYNALQTQIHALRGDTIAKEDDVTAAEEKLHSARLNGGELITNRNSYVENLIKAENGLTAANEALALHKAKIEMLEKNLALLDAEVEDEA